MDTPEQEPKTTKPARPTDRLTKALRVVVGGVVALAALAAVWVGFIYAFSPAAIRHPSRTHYHFRLQVINNGTPVNFAGSAFQTPFNTDTCNAALTSEPIHFHDNLDQFVHIHWGHMTGGLLLKNYGWNFITGPDDTLGYRFDQLPRLARVPAHGQALPKPPADANYYIFTGTKDSHEVRDWKAFLSQDLRGFFADQKPVSLLEAITPAAFAQGAADAHDEHLAQLNDVLGSVVIFAQKDPPTDAQINDRFNHLVPLPESTCGG